ncbi:response regulator, partial [Stieleria sp.]|uniref:hybrid sensor histidine kinase/response regulator n=1 Tax=Stieleria sp. TaxID=2795976 RepID=UPI00356A311F
IEVVVHLESSTEDSVGLQISVRDTGIGIPPDRQQAVFESFRQADASTNRRFGGTGLGLTISTQLVELMNGRIWVESEVGTGTTFHFTARFGIVDPQPTPVDTEVLHGVPVLVVDDNATSRSILDEMLRQWGLAVTVVADGQEALTELQRAAADGRPYPLAILDSAMQPMDGFAIAARLRQDPDVALKDCPIIMLSSAVKAGDVEQCRQLGVARYMQKPAVHSDLLKTILKTTGHSDSSQVSPKDNATKTYRKLKVLLAEDGDVNRKVAVGLLSHQGHEVLVAEDGVEAVAALDEQRFDIVLMDVQMPNMDGIEATRLIREKEHELDRHTPIVAMTAGAMKGDEEHCLEAGMDGYIAKPIDPEKLYDLMERCVSGEAIGPSNDPVSVAPENDDTNASSDVEREPGNSDGSDLTELMNDPAAAKTLAAIDMETARERCRGNDSHLRLLAETLIGEATELMKSMRAAVDSHDVQSIRRSAHSLKGAASVFGATDVVAGALHLETIAESADPAELNAQLDKVDEEVGRLVAALILLCKQDAQC